MTGQLVIVRHFEPPAPEESAELLHLVSMRLLDAALLTRLTQPQGEARIESDQARGEGSYESGTVRES